MKFFISHSSADSKIAELFSKFLSDLNVDVEVFCSSIVGMINQGDNYVKTIEDGLKNSDVFIPLISNHYLDSKYCMIELGYAYSKFANSRKKYNILPFCIPPVTKYDALLGTPLTHLQTAALNSKDEMHNFIRVLRQKELLVDIFVKNEIINNFVDNVNRIIMDTDNILGHAVILPICSDSDNPEAIRHTQESKKHIVNFNLFANKKNKRPDFLSLVLKFPGLFNFNDFLCINNEIKLACTINNYTESLTGINIEFKYGETHQPLKSYQIDLEPGINDVSVPIGDMNIEGLKQISEICFVVWDRNLFEPEGMFTIENIQVK